MITTDKKKAAVSESHNLEAQYQNINKFWTELEDFYVGKTSNKVISFTKESTDEEMENSNISYLQALLDNSIVLYKC